MFAPRYRDARPPGRRDPLAVLTSGTLVLGMAVLIGSPDLGPVPVGDVPTPVLVAATGPLPGQPTPPTPPAPPADQAAPTDQRVPVDQRVPAAAPRGPEAAPVSADCAASWGATGPPGQRLAVPVVQGTDVCRPGAVRPVPADARCTVQVDGAGLAKAVDTAKPGDRICAKGRSTDRLTVKRSGTASAPIQVVGVGDAAVDGITIKADHVVVDGFTVKNADAPAIQLTGRGITVRNNVVSRPTGGDRDGLRFFGSDLQILHNTISDVRNEDGAHADCMQTYATNTPASTNVLIHSNRCEKIENQCLIAEGPNSREGDGSGKGRSSGLTFTHNYCEFGAAQAVMIDNVQDVTVTRNEIVGEGAKAFGFDNGSTGARVSGNTVAEEIDYEVGLDSSSRKGYQGPKVGGAPWNPGTRPLSRRPAG